MKARLLSSHNQFTLLIFNGQILTLSPSDAKAFLLTYDSSSHYSEKCRWDHVGITMQTYRGDTIAIVEDDGTLSIKNAAFFRKIMELQDIEYLTVSEYAERHEKQPAIVRRMCMRGRIEGAFQKGKSWLIPENSPYPEDARVGKRVQT